MTSVNIAWWNTILRWFESLIVPACFFETALSLRRHMKIIALRYGLVIAHLFLGMSLFGQASGIGDQNRTRQTPVKPTNNSVGSNIAPNGVRTTKSGYRVETLLSNSASVQQNTKLKALLGDRQVYALEEYAINTKQDFAIRGLFGGGKQFLLARDKLIEVGSVVDGVTVTKFWGLTLNNRGSIAFGATFTRGVCPNCVQTQGIFLNDKLVLEDGKKIDGVVFNGSSIFSLSDQDELFSVASTPSKSYFILNGHILNIDLPGDSLQEATLQGAAISKSGQIAYLIRDKGPDDHWRICKVSGICSEVHFLNPPYGKKILVADNGVVVTERGAIVPGVREAKYRGAYSMNASGVGVSKEMSSLEVIPVNQDFDGSPNKGVLIEDSEDIRPGDEAINDSGQVLYVTSFFSKETLSDPNKIFGVGPDWKLKLATPIKQQAPTVDIFIGGAGDTWKSGPVREIYYIKKFLPDHPDSTSFESKYFSYDETNPGHGPNLRDYVASLPQGAIINIVGHSWGGDTAVEFAAHSPRPIHLLITIDPVSGKFIHQYPSARRPGQPPPPVIQFPDDVIPKLEAVKGHIDRWINVDAQPAFQDTSDDIATAGGKWDKLLEKYDIVFIPAPGLHHANFLEMMTVPGKDGKSAENILLGQ